MVKWLSGCTDTMKIVIEFIKEIGVVLGFLGAVVLSFRKWVMKPLAAAIEEQKKATVELRTDYEHKRDEVLKEVGVLNKRILENDKKSEERHEKLRGEFKSMRLEMGTMQDDVADVLGNELENGHHKFMTQGWCSPAEKQHYVDLHKRYAARGHNHLAQRYEEDLLELPDHPPQYNG